jgi:hypothetical protein
MLNGRRFRQEVHLRKIASLPIHSVLLAWPHSPVKYLRRDSLRWTFVAVLMWLVWISRGKEITESR